MVAGWGGRSWYDIPRAACCLRPTTTLHSFRFQRFSSLLVPASGCSCIVLIQLLLFYDLPGLTMLGACVWLVCDLASACK